MAFMNKLSEAAIPVIIIVIFVIGAWKNVQVFDVFIEGAKEGMATAIRLYCGQFQGVRRKVC